MKPAPPAIRRVVETALYVEDMSRAVAFYRDVLGLAPMSVGNRLSAFDAGAATVLLLFHRGATREGFRWPGGFIPPHDGSGPLHVAFAVDGDDLEAWERALVAHGVAIESRVTWERGGRSLYLRDPDGHSVELVTPRTWANY
ncbi:MAG TPA: VOC family protein [Dongiaceae bacterium]|nr:VOC family protein [Dongiaceae bacterium]